MATFSDDFDRPDGPVGNGWVLLSGKAAQIVDGHVEQANDWSFGYSRPLAGAHRVKVLVTDLDVDAIAGSRQAAIELGGPFESVEVDGVWVRDSALGDYVTLQVSPGSWTLIGTVGGAVEGSDSGSFADAGLPETLPPPFTMEIKIESGQVKALLNDVEVGSYPTTLTALAHIGFGTGGAGDGFEPVKIDGFSAEGEGEEPVDEDPPITGTIFWGGPFDGPDGVDISEDILGFSVDRGGASDLGSYGPGRATLILKNTFRQYEPFYSGSPYYPNVKHRSRVQIVLGTESGEEQIFDGYIMAISPTYPLAGYDAVVSVECADLQGMVVQDEMKKPIDFEITAKGANCYLPLNDGEIVQGSSPGFPDQVVTSFADHSGNQLHALAFGDEAGFTAGTPGPYVAVMPDDKSVVFTPDEEGVSNPAYINLTGALDGMVDNAPVTLLFYFLMVGEETGTDRYIVVQRGPSHGSPAQWFIAKNADGHLVFSGGGVVLVVDDQDYRDSRWHLARFRHDGAVSELMVWPANSIIPAPPDSEFAAGSGLLVDRNYALAYDANLADPAKAFNGFLSNWATFPRAITDLDTSDIILAGMGWPIDRTDQRFKRLLANNGIPEEFYEAAPSALGLMLPAVDYEGRNVSAALAEIDESEAGAMFTTRHGVLTLVPRDGAFGQRPQSSESQATFGELDDEIRFRDLRLTHDSYTDVAGEVTVRQAAGGWGLESTRKPEGSELLGAFSKGRRVSRTTALASWWAPTALANLLAERLEPDRLRVAEMEFLYEGDKRSTLARLELHDRVTVKWTPTDDADQAGTERMIQETLVTGLSWRKPVGSSFITLKVECDYRGLKGTIHGWDVGAFDAEEFD